MNIRCRFAFFVFSRTILRTSTLDQRYNIVAAQNTKVCNFISDLQRRREFIRRVSQRSSSFLSCGRPIEDRVRIIDLPPITRRLVS